MAGSRLPLLEAALAARPDDVTACECKGHALAGLGRFNEALHSYLRVLSLEPGREFSLVEAARVALKLGRRQDAVAYWQQAIAIDPWRSDYHAGLALVWFQDGDWRASAEACRQAILLNAVSIKPRKLLVQCELNLGNTAAARAELETILGFDPPDRADLLRSFSEQSRSRNPVP